MFILFIIHLLASFYASYWILEKITFVPETAGGALLAFLFSYTVFWGLLSVFQRRYFKLVIQLMYLLKYFIKEFIRSNVRLTKEIITPRINLRPAVVKVPLSLHSDMEIMILTNIANLTPGTLIVGISDDKRYFFVHTIYLEGGSLPSFKQYMQEGFEKRLLQIAALSKGVNTIQTSGKGDNEVMKKINKTKKQ
ncbi:MULTISPECIES: Na+/H+ antiporter subunit E [Sphingobacteriaceae]|uniref:Cation antiporter n=1 Tax=Sphingobacterium sp. (strain 21) TaxID=743722 RepID=F4C3U8_SPHS2